MLSLSDRPGRVYLPFAALVNELAAADLDARSVTINGRRPVITQTGPKYWPVRHKRAGSVLRVRPRSVVFIEMRKAGNPACS